MNASHRASTESSDSSQRVLPPPSLTQQTGWLLSRIGRRRTQIYAEWLKPLDLRPRDAAVLIALDELPPPVAQHELSQSLFIDQSTIVLIVDKLERDGLVRRRQDERDRRRNAIELTDAGRACLAKVREVVAESQQELFRVLAGDEHDQLVQLLRKVARSMEILP